MQKMLTWLVVGLTLAVGVLGVFTFKLYMDGGGAETRLAPANPPPRAGVVTESVDPARIELLERRLAALQAENEAQKRRLTILANAAEAAALRTPEGNGPEGCGGDGPPDPRTSTEGWNPTRGEDGAFQISPEEEDYFVAVQERVETRRRVDGLTKNVMRRVERLAARGEIGALPQPTRERVEGIVRGFVRSGDELTSRYIRSPSPEMAALTADERREAMMAERTTLVARATGDLEPVVGAADAAKIAEESLQNPWGLRKGEGFDGRRRGAGDEDGK